MERFPRIPALAAASLFLLAAALPAAAVPRDRVREAVRDLESFFPPVSGLVVSVLGQKVFTDVPASAGLRPGSELAVIREGENIVHPLTGQVLGRYETTLGVLRVTDIRSDYTTGELVGGSAGEEILVGDLVRVTAARLRVGLVEGGLAEEGAQEWMNEVFFALEDSDRFQPLETDGVAAAELADASRVRDFCAGQGLQALLTVETGETGGFLVMHLYSGATGFRVASSRFPVAPGQRRAAAAGAEGQEAASAPMGTAGGPPARTGWETIPLDYPVAGFCRGNLTGAGEELAVSDGRRTIVYRRVGDEWDPFWEDGGKSLYRVVSLDCGDVDGNGRDELFVSRIAIGQLKSVVLEYDGREFAEKDGPRNLFYRVVTTGGQVGLFAQEFDSRDVAGARADRYGWDGTGYSRVEAGRMAAGVHGFGLADIDGDGEGEVLTLEDSGLLSVRRASGELLWHSRETFGGSSLFLDAERLGQDLPRKETGGYVVRGRIAGADLDGDGAEELVLVRNVPTMGGFLRNVRRFDRAILGVYRWNGREVVRVGDPEEIDGYVADYAVHEGSAGTVELVLGVNEKSSSLRRGSAKIMTRLLTLGG